MALLGGGRNHRGGTCRGGDANAIRSDLNPAHLPPDRRRMICGQCHSLGTDPSGRHPFPVMAGGMPFRPGEDLTAAFVDTRPVVAPRGGQYSLLVQAPAYYAGQGCTDCHDPHGRAEHPAMLLDPTSGLCRRCHGDALGGATPVNGARHWGADKQPCWACHEYAHTH